MTIELQMNAQTEWEPHEGAAGRSSGDVLHRRHDAYAGPLCIAHTYISIRIVRQSRHDGYPPCSVALATMCSLTATATSSSKFGVISGSVRASFSFIICT